MHMSYRKLWILLDKRKMRKKDLSLIAGVSHTSIAKLSRNKNVTTDVLVKICHALECDISDVMEYKDVKK